MNAIEITDLSKSYDGKEYAVKSLNLSISQGEIFGFLGPNGSGKTTTVRILNGILSATEGHGYMYGMNIGENITDIHKICGVMTETALLYESLTGIENLMFFGKMYGLTKDEVMKTSNELLSRLELSSAKDKKVNTYSTGMKKRISLARALIHKPKILFLDEPTSGLDPETARNVTMMIKDLAIEQGVTVFLCTHQLKYAEEICSSYGFIQEGKLIAHGTFNELLNQKQQSIWLDIRGENIPKTTKLNKIGQDVFRASINNDTDASEIIDFLVRNGGKIFEAKKSKWSLEDLYFSYQEEK